eukprot:2050418-Prymnesium_polylepis.1
MCGLVWVLPQVHGGSWAAPPRPSTHHGDTRPPPTEPPPPEGQSAPRASTAATLGATGGLGGGSRNGVLSREGSGGACAGKATSRVGGAMAAESNPAPRAPPEVHARATHRALISRVQPPAPS